MKGKKKKILLKKLLKNKPVRLIVKPCLNHIVIAKLRKREKLTMVQAAVATGMKFSQSWYRLESGQRKSVSMETLASIARVLKCKVDDLLIY